MTNISFYISNINSIKVNENWWDLGGLGKCMTGREFECCLKGRSLVI